MGRSSAKIELTRGKVALVSAHRFAELSDRLWHAALCGDRWYARRFEQSDGVRRTIYLHRWITGAADHLWVDHANGDGLDCRDENLRVVPPRLNNVNRTWLPGAVDYVGVDIYDTQARRRFRARIVDNEGRRRTIGIFDTPVEAALAYDREALRLRGPFARVNFATSMPVRPPPADPIPF